MAGRTEYDVPIIELTEAEGVEVFEQVCRKEMGIGSAEFLRRWDAGEFEGVDFDAVPGLVGVWMSMPLVR